MQIQQGSITVNGADIRAQSDNIVCIDVDLKAKYADVWWVSGEGIAIGTKDSTLFAEDTEYPTILWFEDYADGEVFGWPTIGRYTLSVALIKPSGDQS